MTTTRTQMIERLMEMLGEATERDGQITFDHLFATGKITRDPNTPGNYILGETTDAEWQLVLDACATPQITPDPETGYYTLPTLGGEDVTRYRTDILVEIGADGVARNPAHYDEPWAIVGRATLRGWGSLDGDAYTLSCGAAWTVDVPVAAWSALPIDSEI